MRGIRFLQFGGRRVAYAVTGSGPPLVAPAWWVSHLELDWRDDAFRTMWESVGAGYTLIRYDRPGVGMSDRDVHDDDLTLDGEVALLCAVLDELALEKVTLVGGSSGGCAAIALAARFPERVDRLLLYGAYADGPAITASGVGAAIVGTVRSHWGLGSRVLADIFLGDTGGEDQDRLARYQRASASPETAAVLLELVYRNDVRSELADVRAPTLVVHRRGDRAIPYQLGLAGPWRRFGRGCRCNRTTAETIVSAGFVLDDLQHRSWRAMPPIVRPLIAGRAHIGASDG